MGKTQIARRLQGADFDESVSSTHGITVTAMPWNAAEGDCTLNVWDFGGQDIYHGAHSLFMRTRAALLVVWHPDFECGDEKTAKRVGSRNYPLTYWLDYVRALARPKCPVLVVQTRCERPDQEVRKIPVPDDDLRLGLCQRRLEQGEIADAVRSTSGGQHGSVERRHLAEREVAHLYPNLSKATVQFEVVSENAFRSALTGTCSVFRGTEIHTIGSAGPIRPRASMRSGPAASLSPLTGQRLALTPPIDLEARQFRPLADHFQEATRRCRKSLVRFRAPAGRL